MKTAGKLSALFLAAGLLAGHSAWAEEAAKPKREFSEKQLAQQQAGRACANDGHLGAGGAHGCLLETVNAMHESLRGGAVFKEWW